MRQRNPMPCYFLPSIYLGSGPEAKAIRLKIRDVAKRNPKLFNSQNDFLRYCIAYTLEHDLRLKDEAA